MRLTIPCRDYTKPGMVDNMRVATLSAAMAKLAAYEDAEEQGLLVRLPCKVGDKVFYTTGSTVHVAKADMFRINASGFRVYCERKYAGLIGFEGIFGKTVFLTREEADAALKGEREDV